MKTIIKNILKETINSFNSLEHIYRRMFNFLNSIDLKEKEYEELTKYAEDLIEKEFSLRKINNFKKSN